MMKGNRKGNYGRYLRAGVVFSVLTSGVVMLAGVGTQDTQMPAASTGWGSEALATVHGGLEKMSPIALANACGMGASSCFKCHNGKRAAAPSMDAAKSPWHTHHAKVNNSCVGCHKGNPRLMKEDMAHAGMLKAPKGGAEACGSCHKNDLNKVEAKYKS